MFSMCRLWYCGIGIVSTMRVRLRQLRRQIRHPKRQVNLLRTDPEYKIQYISQVCKHMSGIEEIYQHGGDTHTSQGIE